MDYGSTLMCIIVVASLETELSSTWHCNDDGNKVVKLCQTNNNSDTRTIYLDTAGAPLSQLAKCICTLEVTPTGGSSPGVVVTSLKDDSGIITLEVDGYEIDMTRHAVKEIPYKQTMRIEFRKNTDDQVNNQCFEFKGSSSALRSISIKCKPAETTTTQTTPTLNNTDSTIKPSTTTTTQTTATTTNSTPSPLPPTTTTTRTATSTSPATTTTAATTTTDELPKGTDSEQLKDESNDTNIGMIAGAAVGAAVVIVAIVLVTVVVCRRRASKRQREHEETSDPDEKDTNYDMTINAGYVSIDACQKVNDVQRDPRGYALVNKPKPAPKPTQASSDTEYAEYNHLDDVLDNRMPDNVYNTATGTVGDPDFSDYNRIKDIQHNRTPDTFYNTAKAGFATKDVDTGEYNRLNEIQNHNVKDNVYNVAYGRSNTDSVYNHTTDRT